MSIEQVILVDEHDREVGTAEKLAAHRDGRLHRAFSVFVFNQDHELLLQQRAFEKYHSAGLLSNTCCSHPRPGEPTLQAAHRRLQEEMGFDCPLTHAFEFRYRVRLDAGLYEHEFDHVLVGRFDGAPDPDPGEVASWRWASVPAVARELDASPERYTYWFRLAFAQAVDVWKQLGHSA